ncbi:MAG: hypothetical protein U9R25_04795 [Chloroflexota bacterium]|nr:hypothetical protein [Chloroflexota bacterium]
MAETKIDPKLAAELKSQPDAQFDLLVTVQHADDQTEKHLTSQGIVVRRRLRLVPTVAITCSGDQAQELLGYSWVEQIERDQPVHTM